MDYVVWISEFYPLKWFFTFIALSLLWKSTLKISKLFKKYSLVFYRDLSEFPNSFDIDVSPIGSGQESSTKKPLEVKTAKYSKLFSLINGDRSV